MVDRKIENIEVVKKQPLYKKFFRADEYYFKYPHYNGEMSDVVSREILERGNAVGVLLYDPDKDAFIFVEQMRAGIYFAGEDPWILECVAGMIDGNETPERVAVREAKEEAGADVSDLEPITSYFSSPGGMTEKIFLYCGRTDSCRVADYAGLANEDEDIRVVVMPVAEAEKMLKEGEFRNGLTIIALQWFMMNKSALRRKWGKT